MTYYQLTDDPMPVAGSLFAPRAVRQIQPGNEEVLKAIEELRRAIAGLRRDLALDSPEKRLKAIGLLYREA